MPKYIYQGIDRQGKRVSGKLESPNEGEFRMGLRDLGVRPTRIEEEGVLNTNVTQFLSSFKSVPLDAIVVFTRQLQVLVGSGIPLVQSLDILVEQTSNN